jgi:N-acetylglucosaminyl-diphospho-decaprenol L-rhamnosyltransferase
VAGPHVAAVVVNFNAERHLRTCLESLSSEGINDVVVVDNGSTDRSREVAEAGGAVWLPTGLNLGYGRAANMGAAAWPDAPWLLVCNPDVRIEAGAVATLVKSLEADPSLGAVGPRIENVDGSLYPSARTFPDLVDAMGHGLFGLVAPNNRWTRRYRLLDWDHSGPADVDWISGACFVARRQAWNQVGGFDPAYFMYMEDVDLCWRLGRAGWKLGYQPAARVVHAQGVSTDQRPYRMLAAHHRSMWRFAVRTTTGARRAALPVVAIGLAARLAVAAGRRRLDGTIRSTPPRPLP